MKKKEKKLGRGRSGLEDTILIYSKEKKMDVTVQWWLSGLVGETETHKHCYFVNRTLHPV